MNRLNNMVVTKITDIVTISSPKGRFEKMICRPGYGLSFCTEGQITYTHKGKKYISDPNHAIILPKGQSYTLQGDKQGIFPLINFDCINFFCDTMIVLPIQNAKAYIKDYEHMKHLFLFEKNNAKIMSIFYDMIYRLTAYGGTQSNVLLPAIKYLEDNYSSPNITNAALARQCGISEVYFRKLFIKHFGTTPKQFIIDAKINKAKQLLTDGILKINAISENCGFSNPYHFCRLFRKRTGITPTEYMKQNRIYKI